MRNIKFFFFKMLTSTTFSNLFAKNPLSDKNGNILFLKIAIIFSCVYFRRISVKFLDGHINCSSLYTYLISFANSHLYTPLLIKFSTSFSVSLKNIFFA